METRSAKRRRLVMEQDDGGQTNVVDGWGGILDALLLKIFSHLGQRDLLLGAGLVCMGWNRVAKDVSLWKEIELDQSCVTLERARELIMCMTRLKRVRLVKWKEPRVDQVLTLIADLYPRLEVLSLTECYVSSCKMFKHVAQRCKEIEVLKLMAVRLVDCNHHPLDAFAQSANLKSVSLDFTHQCLMLDNSVQRNWPNLTNVMMYYSPYSSDEVLQAVCAASAGHIRKLRIGALDRPESCQLLNQCGQLDDLELVPLCGVQLHHVKEGISRLRNLRRLVLMLYSRATLYEISSFFSAEQVLHKLECLVIADLGWLRDEHLVLIAANCPRLTSISLILCPRITQSGLANLLSKCHKLKSVVLDGIMYRELYAKPDSLLGSLFPGVVFTHDFCQW